MKTTLLVFSFTFITQVQPAYSKVQSLVTGNNPAEIQRNAYRKGMNYPVSELKCSQRCSQWWERDPNNDPD